MKFKSVFDIIGPVMVGPSSSHTAGAARIGRMARTIFGKQPTWAYVHLYGSFAKTYKGHGTDVAIIGGLLDFDTFDERIQESMYLAEQSGLKVTFIEEEEEMEHPNTVRIVMGTTKEDTLEIEGVSIGGGKIEITELNGFRLSLTGHHPAILVLHHDRFGAIAAVANMLSMYEINIGHMNVARKEKGKVALMTIEVDQNIHPEVIDKIQKLPNMISVIKVVD